MEGVQVAAVPHHGHLFHVQKPEPWHQCCYVPLLLAFAFFSAAAVVHSNPLQRWNASLHSATMPPSSATMRLPASRPGSIKEQLRHHVVSSRGPTSQGSTPDSVAPPRTEVSQPSTSFDFTFVFGAVLTAVGAFTAAFLAGRVRKNTDAKCAAPMKTGADLFDRRAVLMSTFAGYAMSSAPALARPQPNGALARLLGVEESKEDFDARAKRVRLEMELEEMAESKNLQYSSRGFKFRDLVPGVGQAVVGSPTVLISYTVYKLAKRSYGGLVGDPIYMFSLGYGNELQDDIGETLRANLQQLPLAVQDGMQGMKEKGRRRILVPPEYGWVSDDVLPRPTTYAGSRQLINHGREPLVFEVELVKVVG